MKTATRLVATSLFVTVFLLAIGCGKKADSKKEDNTDKKDKTESTEKKEPKAEAKPAPVKKVTMAPLALKAAGLDATISAPVGATAKDSYGTIEIKVGDGKRFFVAIEQDAPDMAKRKAYWAKNTAQKLKKVHVDTPEALIVETEAFGKTSFWLDASVKLGDKAVYCLSGRGAHSLSLGQVKAFLAACKTLSPAAK